MNTRSQIESTPATPWQKFSRWFRALDEALDLDPAAQVPTSVQQLSYRVLQLEAVVRRLEAPASSQINGEK